MRPGEFHGRRVPDVLAEWVDRQSDAVALRTVGAGGSEDCTYRQLWDRVCRIRDGAFAGLPSGVRVPMVMPGDGDYVAGFLAAFAAGLVPVPVYLPSTENPERFLARARHILRDCAPSAVYTRVDLIEAVERDPVLAGLAIRTPDSPAADSPPIVAGHVEISENIAFLQYSSGSTGQPKGIVNTHESILRQASFGAGVWNHHTQIATVSWLPLYHDMGIFWGVLIPLLNGGSATLIPPHEFVRNPRIWLETVHETRGNWIAGPDFGYQRCVEAFDDTAIQMLDLSCLRLATDGAEPIRESTLRAFATKFAPAGLQEKAMTPQYGLAEAGLGVTGSGARRGWIPKNFDVDALERGTAAEISAAGATESRMRTLVSCGDATFGWDVRIVDPVRRVVVDDGGIGEIWINGPGLPAGYWQQPELTAAVFGARTADGAGPYLRSGDAGFRYQGELYVCGRYRDLILVGGRNHFPNDIEATVEAAQCGIIPGGACAVQPEDSEGSAWWLILETGAAAQDLDDLSRILRRRILAEHETAPERMVWVPPRALPKTTSGKIKRRAALHRLGAGGFEIIGDVSTRRDSDSAAASTSPSPLVGRVAELLGVRPRELTPDTDLTSLGLTSVMTADIVGWASSRSRWLNFADLYARPTLRDWQRQLESAPATTTEPTPAATSSTWTTTPLQRSYWVGRGAEQPLGGVGCQTYFELVGAAIDSDRLRVALDALARRHPMLRAAFPAADRCVIAPEPIADPLRVHEITDVSDDVRAAHLAEVRRRLRRRRFDIDVGNTWAVELTRLPEGCVVHIAIDLIIADLTSIGTLVRDLAVLYRGDQLPNLPTTAAELMHPAPPPSDTTVERLPEGPQLPRVEEDEIAFQRHEHTLGAVAMKALDEACRDHGVTRAAVFLAAYALVLRRWASQDDFVINVTTFGRSPHAADVVGDFTETHLSRHRVDGQTGFADQAREAQRSLRAALQAPESTELLAGQLRSGTGHSGIAPVVFTYAADNPLLAPGDSDTLGYLDATVSMTPQVIIDHQVCTVGGRLVLSWDHRIGCFPPGTVEDMFDAYVALLERLGVHDWSTPATITIAERSRTTRQQRNTPTGPAPQGLLYDMFLDHTEKNPNRVAVRWRAGDDRDPHHELLTAANSQLTYRELAALARSVATAVAEHHAPGAVIGIQLPKGPAQIVAVLGVMMAGCTYLPVGVDQPAERLARICARSAMAGLIRGSAGAAVGRTTVHLLGSMLACPPREPIRTDPGDPAYVIYTSGSTGEPKGVLVSHAAALNTVVDVNRRNRIDAEDCLLAVSALDFDLSVYDIFGPLSCGAHVVTIGESARRDPFHWRSVIAEFGVTVWNSVPGLMDMLLIAAGDRAGALPSLRSVFLSGDWIPLDLPQRLSRAAPDARLVAMGGATEAAIWSNEFVVDEVDPNWVSIPYGYPLANQAFRVVDGDGNDQPDYVSGELWIGGSGVALGYHNAPELTADRFVHDADGARWYRTGDLGCYWSDGTLQFLGRADSQVKIRGHRVECGEIEHALRCHAGVEAAVVVPIHNSTALGAVVVTDDRAEDFGEDMVSRLRDQLAAQLPQYMIPRAFVACRELPLTANGKVDRGVVTAKIEAVNTTSTPGESGSALAQIERVVGETWSEVLGVDITSRGDNFFAHGGDSLRATEVIARLARKGVAGAEVAQLLSRQTLGDFSATCLLGEPPAVRDVTIGAEVPDAEFSLTRLQQAYALGAAGMNGVTCAPTYFSIVLAPSAESEHVDLDRLVGVIAACTEEFAMLRCALESDASQRVRSVGGAVKVHAVAGGDDPDVLLQQMAGAPFDPHAVPVIQCFAPSASPRHVGLLISYLGLDARSLSTVVTTIIADYQSQPRPWRVDPTAAVFGRFVTEGHSGHSDGVNEVAGPPSLPLQNQPAGAFVRAGFARRSFALDESDAAMLRDQAARLGLTPTVLIFEAFTHALHAAGCGERFAVTVPMSYRPESVPADCEVLGNFTRLARCEVDYTATPPGSPEALAAARRQLWRAVGQGSDATGDLAAMRTAGGYPVVFTSTLGLTRQDPGGLTNIAALTQTPGVWLDCQIEEQVSGIRLSWDVATNVVAEEVVSAAFTRFEAEVLRFLGRAGRSTPPGPNATEPSSDWAEAVIGCALERCRTEHVLPQYTELIRRWAQHGAPFDTDPDVAKAACRLVDIVTGAASPQTLIGDPELTPEAMLLREPRVCAALDDLVDRIFAHARRLGRRLRVMEVGSRTGLITERLTGLAGAVVEDYLCLEPNPVLVQIGAGRKTPIPTRHVDAGDPATDVDVVVCCGSLHQLVGPDAVLRDAAVSAGGWLWVLENSEVTAATLVSAAVIDPGLVSGDSRTLRPADRWWRLVADCGWRPAEMVQDGPGLTLVALRPDSPVTAAPAGQRNRVSESAPAQVVSVAADDAVVTTIAEIWQRHLGIETPTVDDDFFLRGGDSLVATRVYADLRAAGFGQLAFVELFNHPRLGDLAAHSGPRTAPERAAGGRRTDQPGSGDPDRFPLTVVQNAYRAGREGGLILGGVAAHCYFEFELPDFDRERFEAAARELVARHPGLRTTVSAEANTTAPGELGLVHPAPIEPVVADHDDVRGAMRDQVIDLTQRPGIDFGVQTRDDGCTVVGISMDNTMLDGASMMIALAELDHLYRGGAVGELPVLETSFADYVSNNPELLPGADESASAELAASRNYWRARVPSLPAAPQLVDMAALFDIDEPVFERVTAGVPAEHWSAIKESCRAEGVTVASFLLANYAQVLSGWSGTDHFCINVTLFDRDPGVTGIENVIGDFTSLVLLECRVDESAGTWDKARYLQRQLMTDLPHRGADAVWLQRELLRYHGQPAAALFPVVFTSGLGLIDASSRSATQFGDPLFAASQTPQTVLDFQVWERHGALHLSWDFVSQAVSPATARTKLASLVDGICGAADSGGRIDQPLGEPEPRDDLVHRVTLICAAALGRPRVDSRDNFFQLGGDSVTATRVVEQIGRELSASATLRLLFANPVIGDFADRLIELKDGGGTAPAFEEGTL